MIRFIRVNRFFIFIILATALLPLGCSGSGEARCDTGRGTHPLLDLTPGHIRLPFPSRYLTCHDPQTRTGMTGFSITHRFVSR